MENIVILTCNALKLLTYNMEGKANGTISNSTLRHNLKSIRGFIDSLEELMINKDENNPVNG